MARSAPFPDFWPVLLCSGAVKNVRYGSKGDIGVELIHVRFNPNSGRSAAPL
jgi:hypothetical protein